MWDWYIWYCNHPLLHQMQGKWLVVRRLNGYWCNLTLTWPLTQHHRHVFGFWPLTFHLSEHFLENSAKLTDCSGFFLRCSSRHVWTKKAYADVFPFGLLTSLRIMVAACPRHHSVDTSRDTLHDTLIYHPVIQNHSTDQYKNDKNV